MHRSALIAFALTAAAVFCGPAAHADEGMWTLNDFPKAAVKQKYGVEISDAWLQRTQRSITRHESGCTGSFISATGLVLTNHHCVMGCLSEISSSDNDYVEHGYNAARNTTQSAPKADPRSGELTCPTEILSVLIETENVTDKVNAATAGLTDAKANEVRKQTLSGLEAQCTSASKKNRSTGPLACESVTLYQGGQYFLYKYQRYNDVRLVFAPRF